MNSSATQDVFSFFQIPGDERTENMFLMQNPLAISLICSLYTYVALSLGPKLMMNKKPFEINRLVAFYNVFQIVFNSWLFYSGISLWVKYFKWGLICLPYNYGKHIPGDYFWAARVCHLYLMNKIIDLCDTIFFILRKDNKKISGLHVFHHGAMPFFTWFGVKYHPGGNLAFFGIINMFVHIVMYLYYLIAAMGPKYRQYIWWKRYLTQLQLFQFVLVAFYTGFTSIACPGTNNLYLVGVEMSMAVIFFVLFINFYIKAYKTQPGTEKMKPK